MIFRLVMAGASTRHRLIGSLGALFGIAVTYAVCAVLSPAGSALPLLVAPMGASAVLVFAVPASPLAQPWSVIGGNILSVLVGVTVARFVPDPSVAAGLAVAFAILGMSLAGCLHPPGGAAALVAVMGGPAVAAAGYGFAILPVGLNAVVLTLAGMLFHRLSGHRYPYRPAVVVPDGMLHRADIDHALADLDETFDVSRADLDMLLHRAEEHAVRRRKQISR